MGNVEIGTPRLLHLYVPEHGSGEGERLTRPVAPGEHIVHVDGGKSKAREVRINPRLLERLLVVKDRAHRHLLAPPPSANHFLAQLLAAARGVASGPARL